MEVDTDLHPSLHPYCHPQIIYFKFSLMIECRLPFERFVCDYKHSDEDAVDNWNILFS